MAPCAWRAAPSRAAACTQRRCALAPAPQPIAVLLVGQHSAPGVHLRPLANLAGQGCSGSFRLLRASERQLLHAYGRQASSNTLCLYGNILVQPQVSAYIVAELLAAAEASTGASVRKAVISVCSLVKVAHVSMRAQFVAYCSA